jgi:stage II sporulation protein D
MWKRHGCQLPKFLSLFILAFVATSAVADSNAEVRIRLKKQLNQVEISGVDKQTIRVEIKNPNQLLVRWSSGRQQIVEGHTFRVRGQHLQLQGQPAPQEVELIPNDDRGIDVIARMDVDSYLKGVLPSEMPLSWPLEALKAQAVAARSYVLRTMYERREQEFDVDATVIDQVYTFFGEKAIRPEWRMKLVAAIEQTRGEVLTDDNGRTLKAFYHADCGCQTEDPKFVWGAQKSFVSVRDPTCGKRKTYHWDLSLGEQDVQAKLNQYFSLPGHSTLSELTVASRTPSGRVALLAAKFNIGKNEFLNYTINAQIFRKLFGFEKVASSDFTMHKGLNRYQLNGQGLGHGVGLCQWGARAMAKDGARYRDILKSFYPKAKFHSPRKA